VSLSGERERRELVELLRRGSPASLPVVAPALDERFSRLLSAPLPRRPRALLFDIYGTLLASAAGGDPLSGLSGGRKGAGDANWAALEAELAAAGIPGEAQDFAREVGALIRAANDRRRPACPHPEVDIERLLGERFPSAEAARLRRLAVLLEISLNPCAPMPGARETLERLRRDGRPAGLVSNAQFPTPLLLEAHFGERGEKWPFLAELSFFSYALGVAKPDRGAFDRAAAVLSGMGVEAGEAAYLGNSFDNDVAPAKAAGFMAVLFAGDGRSFRPPGAASAIEPDSVVDSLAAFAALAGLG